MTNYKYIHFIGIGGISMSALAEIMLEKGCKISGSDLNSSNLTTHLESKGAEIQIGHSDSIITNQDLIVFSSAVKSDNPEYLKAINLGIKIMERADFLGEIMKDYKYPIAVSGTHGKTSTTGFMSSILLNSEKDPTILLGGEYSLINGNLRIGHDDILLTEACEYKRSFVKFNPQFAIILNIEEDHLDYYSGLDEIKSAFVEFGKKIPKDGYLVYNNDCKNSKGLFNTLSCEKITFGLSNDSVVYAKNLIYSPYPHYDLYFKNQYIGIVHLKVPGEHNVYNSLAAAACSYSMGIENNSIIKGLSNFSGIKRRFEYKGTCNKAIVIDDYAHHPTEIRTTLRTIKKMNKGRCICVFQPHTYTRTKTLLDDFSLAFNEADIVLIIDIYAARETNDKTIHSIDLVNRLVKNNVNALYCSSFEKAQQFFKDNARNNDIILTMGAGDVYLIGEKIID
jgi:UDP-N-acetylmuramate--alanine ligase